MAKAGILVHARHLETIGWDELMWGTPKAGHLGSLPMLVDVLLRESKDEPFTCIVIGAGPSAKNGMSESEYIKHYTLEHLPELKEALLFKNRLVGNAYDKLRERLQNIVVTDEPYNTVDEITKAAAIFAAHNVSKVVQIACASHAPRCIRSQSEARAKGTIPADQLWSVIADDQSFYGETPSSTIIIEPPHRGDDPLLGVEPKLTDVLKPFYSKLSVEAKKEFILMADAFMKKNAS